MRMKAFSAGFDKRKYEFSIYKAIGFSRKEILGKNTSEILLMDLFGLILGACARLKSTT